MGEISELLPCPLCSEEMTVFKDSFIHPANDHCPLNCAEFPLNQATVSGWNRRAEARQAPLTGTEAWSYTINYGPDGEENYANVYTPDGEFVGNLKIHHARAIVGGLNEAAFAARPAADDDADEAYEIGKRDGYEEAVQDIDQLTGGDGEYRFCADGDPERHCPDAATMKAQIAERFAARPAAEPVAVKTYADTVAPYVAAQRMVREAIGELFGPDASIESDEAVLLRGPEPTHEAEAQIAALQRIRSALVSAPAPGLVEALEVARRWLANSMPIVEIDGPKPLPLIDAVLSSITETGGAK